VNPASIRLLLELGLERIAPGLDLNGEQLIDLVSAAEAARCEVPLHHHLPVFHTEHCVFAAFLSHGADFRTCGRPCDRHRLELKDRTGQAHPVLADVGCRNTVFGARPQSGLPYLTDLRRAGVSSYRLELVTENRPAAIRVIDIHRSVWDERRDWRDALAELRADGRYGVSTGSPEPPRAPAKPAGARVKTRSGSRRLHPS
jgi:putative protease